MRRWVDSKRNRSSTELSWTGFKPFGMNGVDDATNESPMGEACERFLYFWKISLSLNEKTSSLFTVILR